MAERKGPKRTGSLYWAKSGWRARLTLDVDGEAVKKSFDLKTSDKAAAKAKLKRLVAQHCDVDNLAAEAARLETFMEAADRIVGASEIRSKVNRQQRLRLHVFPHIGQKPVDQVTAADVRGVLVALAELGMSRQLCTHVRNDMGAVLGDLWREEILRENVVARVKVPKGAKVDRRERAVLDDSELAVTSPGNTPTLPAPWPCWNARPWRASHGCSAAYAWATYA